MPTSRSATCSVISWPAMVTVPPIGMTATARNPETTAMSGATL